MQCLERGSDKFLEEQLAVTPASLITAHIPLFELVFDKVPKIPAIKCDSSLEQEIKVIIPLVIDLQGRSKVNPEYLTTE